jgi:alpha-ketoglutarate-dependent taurine dioxygenase
MTITHSSARLDIAPTSGYIGAEIRSALLAYKVIFFRDQRIGHAEQIAFARLFGKVTAAHPHEENPPEGFPEILPIDSRRYEAQLGRKRTSYDSSWHTDVTALVNPPAASILRAHILPPYGGDTAFANLVAAYENLPKGLRDFADTLDARHAFSARAAPGSQRDRKIRQTALVAWHPVVRVHPETGERALFVSPGFTAGPRELRGYTPSQSDAILRLLWEEATRTEYTTRFRWAPGSVAFWDNRATAHLAVPDAGHLGHDRVLYRVTLEGTAPEGVDGRTSELVSGEPFYGS